jgi:hypothetical protein
LRYTTALVGTLVLASALVGCRSTPEQADLGVLYNETASAIGDQRNPVVVLPGILGTKLEAADGTKVWGSFTFGAADADFPDGARLIALPMERGRPLSALTDDVIPTTVLDVVVADVGLFRGIKIGAYVRHPQDARRRQVPRQHDGRRRCGRLRRPALHVLPIRLRLASRRLRVRRPAP